jgi:hypothetical protein
MLKHIFVFFTVIFTQFGIVSAQAPKLYLNIVSHNEPKDSLHKSSEFNYQSYWVLQFANMIQNKGAKYNLQTCDGFIDGAISFQNASTSSSDVLQVLDTMSNVEIDPRYKSYRPSFLARNYADIAYMLSSIGVNPTHTLGGFLYDNPIGGPDWFPYQDTIRGSAYPTARWRADFLYGPGSNPPHQNDYNDFGIWKPDSVNTFTTHNPNRHLWLIGNGCAPVLDSSTTIQPIIDSIQLFVSRINSGNWPSNKFYSATIMINQSSFGPTLYNKLAQVIDSINITCSTTVEWKLISEKFTAFQSWQTNTNQEFSQWQCGQVSTGINHNEDNSFLFKIYPNPVYDNLKIEFYDSMIHSIKIYDFSGKLLYSSEIEKSYQIDCSDFAKGIYILKIDNDKYSRIIKN